MTDIYNNLSYKDTKSVITHINGKNSTPQLPHTNSTRGNILEMPNWDIEIGYYGCLRSVISYYVTQQRRYEIEIVNKQLIWKVPYRSFHDLFEKSLCINNNFVSVYVPIYFVGKDGNGIDNVNEVKEKLNQKTNMNISTEIGQLDVQENKLFIDDIQIGTELTYQSTIIPLINLSKWYRIQYKRFGRSRLGRTIVETSYPTLEFILTYADYIRVLKCITSKEYKSLMKA